MKEKLEQLAGIIESLATDSAVTSSLGSRIKKAAEGQAIIDSMLAVSDPPAVEPLSTVEKKVEEMLAGDTVQVNAADLGPPEAPARSRVRKPAK